MKVGYYSALGGRQVYEDDLFHADVLANNNLIAVAAVADGMGGLAGGIDASHLAMRMVRSELLALLYRTRDRYVSQDELANLITKVIEEANRRVCKHGTHNKMGTTLTIAVFTEEAAMVGHVGDCRAYVLDGNGLEQITQDHAVGHALTRRLGKESDIEVDVYSHPLRQGQMFLLSSDGLHGQLSNEEISNALEETRSVGEACLQMVNQALIRGGSGSDNVTALALEYGERARREPRPMETAPPVEQPAPTLEPPPAVQATPEPPQKIKGESDMVFRLVVLAIVGAMLAAFVFLIFDYFERSGKGPQATPTTDTVAPPSLPASRPEAAVPANEPWRRHGIWYWFLETPRPEAVAPAGKAKPGGDTEAPPQPATEMPAEREQVKTGYSLTVKITVTAVAAAIPLLVWLWWYLATRRRSRRW